MIKKFLVILCLFFLSLPVLAFESGNILVYPSAGAGYNFRKTAFVGDTNNAIGYVINGNINAEIFIFDFLSVSGGIGIEQKNSFSRVLITQQGITGEYQANIDITLTENFITYPFIVRLHIPTSETGEIFVGGGYQYNVCTSAEYEVKFTNTGTKSGSEPATKLDEKLGIFELGGYMREENVLFGFSLRSFAGGKKEDVVLPGTIKFGKKFISQTLNMSVGVIF